MVELAGKCAAEIGDVLIPVDDQTYRFRKKEPGTPSGAYMLSQQYEINRLSIEKEVPAAIFTLPSHQLARFLGVLWSGDGRVDVNHKSVSYASSSRRLIEDVGHLFLRFGIPGRIITSHTSAEPGGPKFVSYRWEAPVWATKTFVEKIGPHTVGYKSMDLHSFDPTFDGSDRRAQKENDVFWDRVVSIEAEEVEQTYCFTMPKYHNFIANDIVVHNCFKANSAILNSLLTLMNERLYHNDGQPLTCPLVTMFGASNELPEGRELEAMFDRFLVRFDVQYLVQLSNLRAVLLAPDPVISAHLTMEELLAAQAEVAKVTVTEETVDGLISIREGCQSEGIIASDRRWKKALKLVRASAYMLGSMKTTPEDLHILVDSLWREPKERNKVARIVGQQSDPVGTVANEILEAARETAQRMVTLKKKGRAEYIGAAAQAIDQFVEQKNKLVELSKTGGKRAKVVIADAQREIQGMHAEAARVAMEGLGMGNGKGKKGSWMKDVDASLDAE